MKKILFGISLLIGISLSRQSKKSYTIEGIISSRTDTTFLESATVHLEKIKDSSVVSYTIEESLN